MTVMPALTWYPVTAVGAIDFLELQVWGADARAFTEWRTASQWEPARASAWSVQGTCCFAVVMNTEKTCKNL
jgi:hypothetical protein